MHSVFKNLDEYPTPEEAVRVSCRVTAPDLLLGHMPGNMDTASFKLLLFGWIADTRSNGAAPERHLQDKLFWPIFRRPSGLTRRA
jgi:hypothetical protein